MQVEEHEKAYQEHLKNLNNAIEGGVEENQRNILCYGKRKPGERIAYMIKSFHELRKAINENLRKK